MRELPLMYEFKVHMEKNCEESERIRAFMVSLGFKYDFRTHAWLKYND